MKPAELEANRDRLKEKWNPDQPIEHFFNKVTQVRAIATRNGSAISDDATVTLCRSAFEGAGVYGQAILTWDTKALTDHTWTNFEPHFLLYEEARLEGLKTAKQAGFHGANHVLYTATGTPVLTQHTNPANNENTPPPLCHRCNNANATPPSQQQKAKPEFLYCWTHGLTKGKANHTSKNCTEPTEGHMKQATIYRRYGGSTSFDTLTTRTNRYQQSTNDGATRPAST
ncbi:unnamed protein product [Cylindrotheca closterium]|uniref:Uncharacterized protein n=1 Tax=Cylindrotheca closterium TaxID=2856 RepID=A0AAD2CNR1_9STRA|nr:unnamed protein product [Cylindrotheca closterium]